MLDLFAILAPIALLDSTSLLPVALVPLISLLASRRPALSVTAFLLGILIPYLAFGVALYLGFSELFQGIGAWLGGKWKDPDAIDLVFQILVGVALLWAGWRMGRTSPGKPDREVDQDASPGRAFLFSATLVGVGLPGAVPYFAAMDQILRADPTETQGILALLFYNLMFMAPFLVVIAVRAALGEMANALLDKVNSFASRWGTKLVRILLFALGVALILDGFGWFLGMPFLPEG